MTAPTPVYVPQPSLATIWQAVQAQIVSDIQTWDGERQEQPSFGFTAADRHVQHTPPRIVLVPRTETLAPAGGLGGDGIKQPRVLFCRRSVVELYIEGTTTDDVERLVNHALAAIHAVLYGAYQFEGGTWDAGQESLNSNALLYVARVAIMVPVVRMPEPVVPITAFAPVTTAFDGLVPTG